ncbi:MAG: dienelactone hydrolase family protein [Pseudomonadota bacterium]
MRLSVCLALIGLCSLAQADPNFEFNLERGPYAVGVRVLEQYDYARVYKRRFDTMTGKPVQGERARPIQALVWYPTRQGGTPVLYDYYVRTTRSEEDFTMSPQEIERQMAAWIVQRSARLSKVLLQKELARPMWAVRDAIPAPGKYPLVVYAPSFSASANESADMCEYLASQGYVVIASPDMGTRTREMNEDLEGIETQAADIHFLISSAHTLPQADMGHIAVVGFSWGGISNVFAAARDDRIGALVSLDGSLRSFPKFVDGGADAAKYVTPDRVAVPLLYIASRPKSIEQLGSEKSDLAYSFMNSMKYSDVYLATMQPMVHPDFSSYYLRVVPADPAAPYSRQEVLTAYGWTVRYVHQFLDAYLKQSAPALAFLKTPDAANGAPRHMMTLEMRPAKSTAPNFERLTLELNTNGFEHAVAVYKKMRQTDPKFSVSENSMNEWGYALYRAGRSKDAIEVFKLGVTAYPESGNLSDSLAEVYESVGNKALAIEHYRRAHDLDEDNSNAVRHLKALGAPQ